MTPAGLLVALTALTTVPPAPEIPTLVHSVFELEQYAVEYSKNAPLQEQGNEAIWVGLPHFQAPPQGSWLFRASGKANYFVFGTDYASTEAGLRSDRNLYEGNFTQRNAVVRAVSHVVLPILVNHLTEKLRRRGNEKPALIIRLATNGLLAFSTVSNINKIGGR